MPDKTGAVEKIKERPILPSTPEKKNLIVLSLYVEFRSREKNGRAQITALSDPPLKTPDQPSPLLLLCRPASNKK